VTRFEASDREALDRNRALVERQLEALKREAAA
jgi:hypothetical protein